MFRKSLIETENFQLERGIIIALQIPCFLLSSIKIEESIIFVQIFEFRFLIDLHALRRPERDITIFGKCLSVCLSMSDKNCVTSVAQELMHRM